MNESNSTAALAEDPSRIGLLILQVGYFVSGTIAAALVTFVLLCMKRCKLLRHKDAILMAGFMVAEVYGSLALVTAGLYRIPVILSNSYLSNSYSHWDCCLTPHSILFGMYWVADIIMIASAIDRFLAAYAHVWYYKQDQKYAWTIVVCIFGITLALFALSLIQASLAPRIHMYSPLCSGLTCYPTWFSMGVLTFLPAISGWICMGIYITTILYLRYRVPDGSEMSKSQARITRVLTEICAIRFFLFTIPDNIRYFATKFVPTGMDLLIYQLTFCLISVYIIANTIFFVVKTEEVRMEVAKYRCCAILLSRIPGTPESLPKSRFSRQMEKQQPLVSGGFPLPSTSYTQQDS